MHLRLQERPLRHMLPFSQLLWYPRQRNTAYPAVHRCLKMQDTVRSVVPAKDRPHILESYSNITQTTRLPNGPKRIQSSCTPYTADRDPLWIHVSASPAHSLTSGWFHVCRVQFSSCGHHADRRFRLFDWPHTRGRFLISDWYRSNRLRPESVFRLRGDRVCDRSSQRTSAARTECCIIPVLVSA